jgi:hypothetical protein
VLKSCHGYQRLEEVLKSYQGNHRLKGQRKGCLKVTKVIKGLKARGRGAESYLGIMSYKNLLDRDVVPRQHHL